MENMCREAEKCRVRSRSSSRPTGLFSDNQLTGCLWMIDSKGDRLAQRGGRVKLPQTTPGQTSSYSNTHTFLGNRLKIRSLLRLRGPSLCVVVHNCLPASITPSALLLSHCLTLRVIHTQPNVAVWYKHKGSLFRNYNPTQIQHCEKKAKEWEGNKKRTLWRLAAYISSRDFHRINGEQEKVKWARLWEILQNWKKIKNFIFIKFFSTFIWIVGAVYNQIYLTVWNYRIFGTAEEKL